MHYIYTYLYINAYFSLLFLFLCSIMPESPRWLLAKGRTEEAKVIVDRMAYFNKKTAPENLDKFKTPVCPVEKTIHSPMNYLLVLCVDHIILLLSFFLAFFPFFFLLSIIHGCFLICLVFVCSFVRLLPVSVFVPSFIKFHGYIYLSAYLTTYLSILLFI